MAKEHLTDDIGGEHPQQSGGVSTPSTPNMELRVGLSLSPSRATIAADAAGQIEALLKALRQETLYDEGKFIGYLEPMTLSLITRLENLSSVVLTVLGNDDVVMDEDMSTVVYGSTGPGAFKCRSSEESGRSAIEAQRLANALGPDFNVLSAKAPDLAKCLEAIGAMERAVYVRTSEITSATEAAVSLLSASAPKGAMRVKVEQEILPRLQSIMATSEDLASAAEGIAIAAGTWTQTDRFDLQNGIAPTR